MNCKRCINTSAHPCVYYKFKFILINNLSLALKIKELAKLLKKLFKNVYLHSWGSLIVRNVFCLYFKRKTVSGNIVIRLTMTYTLMVFCREQAGRPKCPLDPYFIMPDKCTCVDFQVLKLQELNESIPQGEMPRHLQLYADR